MENDKSINGLLLVNKPKGWTSFDVVAKVRSSLRQAQKQEKLGLSHLDAVQGSNEQRARRTEKYGERAAQAADAAMRSRALAGVPGSAGQQGKAVRKIRVGHCGTLDPLATGLLVILVGSYCKRAQEFSKLDKTYEVTMKLGEVSDTGDEEGKKTIISQQTPTIHQIKSAIASFIGEIDQVPPAYSAIKVNGQRAYKLARAGKEVKLEPRKVKVYSIKLTDYSYPEVKFTAEVSSGTYIRSLVEDMGQKLGTGAYMSALRRTQVGKFKLKDAEDIDNLNRTNLNDFIC